MAALPMRQLKIWWHWGEPVKAGGQSIAWWHVELHEYEPLIDHGQKARAGSWSRTEHVFNGYDPDLSLAARKALKRARDRKP